MCDCDDRPYYGPRFITLTEKELTHLVGTISRSFCVKVSRDGFVELPLITPDIAAAVACRIGGSPEDQALLQECLITSLRGHMR